MLGMRAAARQHHGWHADGHGATDAHLYGDPSDAAVPALLDSRFDGDKLDALNHLLALIAQDVDVSYLFPQAVKNVVAQSLELKTLVPSTSTSACSTTPRELPTLIWCAPVCSVSDCDAPRNIKTVYTINGCNTSRDPKNYFAIHCRQDADQPHSCFPRLPLHRQGGRPPAEEEVTRYFGPSLSLCRVTDRR